MILFPVCGDEADVLLLKAYGCMLLLVPASVFARRANTLTALFKIKLRADRPIGMTGSKTGKALRIGFNQIRETAWNLGSLRQDRRTVGVEQPVNDVLSPNPS